MFCINCPSLCLMHTLISELVFDKGEGYEERLDFINMDDWDYIR